MNKKLLAVAIAGVIGAPMAAQAIEFKTSGHVNRMIRYVDDGQGSDVQHMDNSASMSRFRFVGSGDIGNGMKTGVNVEAGFASYASSLVGMKAAAGGGGNDWNLLLRHSDLWVSGNWGKVSLGHSSVANDGTATGNFSRAWMVDEPTSAELVSSVAYRTTGGGTAGVTVGGASAVYDGNRDDRLRYDTPALGPAKLAVSAGNNGRWSVGGKLSHDLAGGSFFLNGGYEDREQQSAFSQWGVSAGFKFSQGTHFSVSYSERDRTGAGAAGRNSDDIWFQLGHNWGNSGVSVSYGDTSDHAALGVDAQRWGVGFQHSLPGTGLEVYAGYKHFELDGVANAEDVDTVVAGARLKFN